MDEIKLTPAQAEQRAQHLKRVEQAQARHRAGRPKRMLIGLAVVVAMGLGAYGIVHAVASIPSGEAETTITSSGTYEVGEDIAPGNWAITVPTGTRTDPCRFSVWRGDTQLVSSDTIAAGGPGIPLRDGQTLITIGCGTWSKVG